jgi:addiction module RelE/StbE family toxin
MGIIRYTIPALKDLKDIRDYIAEDSLVNAKRFIEAIREHITRLKNYPEIGSLVFPTRFKDLRQLLHKNYRIVYHYTDEVVTIITIHHQSRLIENITAVKEYKE